VSEPAARTPEQIEAEIQVARSELTGNIDVLQRRLSPASLVEAVRDKAVGVVRRPDGSLDPVRASVAAGVVVVLALYLIRRRRL
jgi:hypothetical protein